MLSDAQPEYLRITYPNCRHKAVAWLRCLVAGNLPLSVCLHACPVCVGFVVQGVAVLRDFLPVKFSFFKFNISPMLLNHFILVLLLSEGRADKAFAILNKIVIPDVGKTWTESYFNIC